MLPVVVTTGSPADLSQIKDTNVSLSLKWLYDYSSVTVMWKFKASAQELISYKTQYNGNDTEYDKLIVGCDIDCIPGSVVYIWLWISANPYTLSAICSYSMGAVVWFRLATLQTKISRSRIEMTAVQHTTYLNVPITAIGFERGTRVVVILVSIGVGHHRKPAKHLETHETIYSLSLRDDS